MPGQVVEYSAIRPSECIARANKVGMTILSCKCCRSRENPLDRIGRVIHVTYQCYHERCIPFCIHLATKVTQTRVLEEQTVGRGLRNTGSDRRARSDVARSDGLAPRCWCWSLGIFTFHIVLRTCPRSSKRSWCLEKSITSFAQATCATR